MINKLKNWKILKGNTAAGVHVVISGDSAMELSLVLLQKSKSSLNVKNSIKSVATFEELSKEIPKNTPVYLAVDGKGIMHKKVNISGDIDEKTALEHILPNASPDDFMVEVNPVSADKSFVSVARKENISNLVSEMVNAGINVQNVTLGSFTINNILAIIKNLPDEIIINENKIEIKEERIFSIEKSNENNNYYTFKIGSENINQDVIVAFASAFSHFTENQTDSSSIQLLQNRQEEYFFKKLFVVSGWAVLIFLFCILLVNFLMFDHYNNKSNDLSVNVNQNKDLLTRLDTLTSQLKQKETFIKKGGFLNPSRTSFYSDRLALLLYDETMLTRIEINPLQKKLKQGDEPLFSYDIIAVEGITTKSTVLNDWIHILKKENWINDVVLINYVNESGSSSAEFELEIKIKR